ncbi:TrmH family RNA methyltransferase [Branchiibius cervicis]|uniref:TrmH family RNA methyltransferase n=1 Tax=Branchiibius cervicis TaxID=908252 RepID=A0ABW2AXZ8_9MICO
MSLHITSAANPRLKALATLRRRRGREQTGQTLVEGYDELGLALSAGVCPQTLFLCPDLMADPAGQQDVVDTATAAGAEVITLSRAAFEKVAYREGADGFLAVVPAVLARPEDLELPAQPLLLVAEAVEKPGNLGAMLRTADAAGVDAFVAADPVTDWGNPNVVRASKGTVFSVPVAAAPTTATLQWLSAHGVRLVATTPDTDTLHTDVDLTGPVAIAVGTEKTGLTEEVLDAADVKVRIPMSGIVNSLNVATSAAIVIYEAVRQRRSGG